MKVSVVIEPADDEGFTAYIPQLPGCISEGKTEDEALQNFREALKLYFEPDEEEIPRDKPGVRVKNIEV
jgi:predicted RNase H-like HicB family nuclease